jgi:hypothetical protein
MTNAKDKPAAAAIKDLLSQGPAQDLFDNADVSSGSDLALAPYGSLSRFPSPLGRSPRIRWSSLRSIVPSLSGFAQFIARTLRAPPIVPATIQAVSAQIPFCSK